MREQPLAPHTAQPSQLAATTTWTVPKYPADSTNCLPPHMTHRHTDTTQKPQSRASDTGLRHGDMHGHVINGCESNPWHHTLPSPRVTHHVDCAEIPCRQHELPAVTHDTHQHGLPTVTHDTRTQRHDTKASVMGLSHGPQTRRHARAGDQWLREQPLASHTAQPSRHPPRGLRQSARRRCATRHHVSSPAARIPPPDIATQPSAPRNCNSQLTTTSSLRDVATPRQRPAPCHMLAPRPGAQAAVAAKSVYPGQFGRC
jgi:hypothetical protein